MSVWAAQSFATELRSGGGILSSRTIRRTEWSFMLSAKALSCSGELATEGERQQLAFADGGPDYGTFLYSDSAVCSEKDGDCKTLAADDY